jgi:hypothetical protein
MRSRPQAVQIKAQINMDGRCMAEAISHHIVRDSQNMRGGAWFDRARTPRELGVTLRTVQHWEMGTTAVAKGKEPRAVGWQEEMRPPTRPGEQG